MINICYSSFLNLTGLNLPTWKLSLFYRYGHNISRKVHIVPDVINTVSFQILAMAISDARLKEYIANFILLCIVVISWTYTIISGKFISERHLHTLNLEEHHRNIDKLLLQGDSIQTVQIKPKKLRVNF